MPTTAYETYSLDILRPAFADADARQMPITLSPGTYAKGARLAQITTATAQVQTATVSGSPTGGTFTLKVTGGTVETAAIAYNAAAATVQTAIRALGGVYAGVVVTGSAGGPFTITFPTTQGNVTLLVIGTNGLTGGSSPTVAVVNTTAGVGPLKAWAAYSSGASDGRQTARLLLRQACVVADDGSISGVTNLDVAGQTVTSGYYCGIFKQTDLSGITAGEITSLGGRILSGALADSDALILIPGC
jgi:hypothetical protein